MKTAGPPTLPMRRRPHPGAAAAIIRRVALWLFLSATATAAAEPPQRIVSLDLCMDWILAHHADPAEVASLPPLHRQYPVDWMDDDWPTHGGSLEQICQLQPVLVLGVQFS